MARIAARFSAFLAASLLAGAAFAAPQVALGQMQVAGGTIQGYLASHGANAAVAGPCYTHTTDPNTSYTCLDQALNVTGLSGAYGSTQALTLFAPNDTAFQQLESSIGMSRFMAFMQDKAALTTLIQGNTVSGAVTTADLGYDAAYATGAATLTSQANASLAVQLGSADLSAATTSVAVGPSNAVSGQAYVFGQDIRADNGVIVPIDRIDLASSAL